MIPNPWFKIAFILVGCLFCAFLGWYPEHLQLVNFKQKVEADAKVQIQKNKDLVIQQLMITKQVQNDYENKLNLIKSYYSGLHYPSSSKLSNTSESAITINGISKDPISIAKDCAIETEKLISLQAWIRSQVGLYDEK